MDIKPILDRVVVEPTEAEGMTAGGLIIPGAAEEKNNQGTIVAVGPGTRKEDGSFSGMSIKTGDTVIFNDYGKTEVNVEGTDYLILSETNILGVLE